MFKAFLKRATPGWLLALYHFLLAKGAALAYGYPSEKLVVIGVTGTNGKSSTVHLLGRILEHAGHTVGWTSTAGFKVGKNEWVNDKKMTMLGRMQTQKLLRDMVRAGCTHAIVETSSQGVAQFRHVGINYDVVVFTNLTPEHIESHGGFENYKKAKGKLFARLAKGRRKTFEGKMIPKQSVVNTDDEHAEYFLSFDADQKCGYQISTATPPHPPLERGGMKRVVANHLLLSADHSSFKIGSHTFSFSLIGRFNAYNVLAAISTAMALGLDPEMICDAVARLEPIPGRMERVETGQPFSVFVDYAYEPVALGAIYETLRLFERKRLIHVLGSAGGGRDVARRSQLGELAALYDDIVIVTNEDPYDDDPAGIIKEVADAAAAAGKREGETLFRILDRQQAISKAIALAQEDDIVLVTGKGSEPVMAVADGKKIPWDDREAVRLALNQRV